MNTTRHTRCLDCRYDLSGLTSCECPECGRAFDHLNPSTFDTRTPFVFWTYWMPGILISGLIGFLCITGLFYLNSTGWAIWVGVPIVMGAGLAIYCRASRAVLILLSMCVIGGVIISLGVVHIAGMFCALVLFVVTIVPFGIGLVIGTWIRSVLKDHDPLFRSYLPAILLLLSPFALHFAGLSGGVHTTELAVTTTRIVIGTPEDVWETLMFFEDIDTPPPLLIRIALPRPLYSTGEMKSVGDRRVCVYTKGNLTKEITEIEEHSTLAFRVVEQGFEPSVRLTRGRFTLEAQGDGRTRISLTTRYIPIHTPRVAWRWAEIVGAKTLHTHVINGIESQILIRSDTLAGEP